MIDLFKDFPKEREMGLKKLYRYSSFDCMFYRSNLWDHAFRVSWLVEDLEGVVRKHYKKYDAEKARIMALVHDDAELFTGDIQSRVKVRASKKATEKMDADERKASTKLSAMSPKMVGGYVYKALLMEMTDRDSVEAQVVTYADKLDAYCESMHEVFAGNLSLLQSAIFCARRVSWLDKKFPFLAPVMSDRSSALTDLESFLDLSLVEIQTYLPFNKPFTKTTVKLPTTILFYDKWREITLLRGGKEGMRMLTKQLEFLPKK